MDQSTYYAGADNSAFRIAFTTFAIGGTLGLVSYAFLSSPDAVDRALMIVQGCEAIVGILLGGVALHLVYLSAMRHSSRVPDSMSSRIRH
jgi:hypothetical protein